jgi:hypothetical protein
MSNWLIQGGRSGGGGTRNQREGSRKAHWDPFNVKKNSASVQTLKFLVCIILYHKQDCVRGKSRDVGPGLTASKFAPREGVPGPTASKLYPGRVGPGPTAASKFASGWACKGPFPALTLPYITFCIVTTFANLLGMFSEYMCTVWFNILSLHFLSPLSFFFVLFLLLPENKGTTVLELFNNLYIGG